jgi:hypothetical protein
MHVLVCMCMRVCACLCESIELFAGLCVRVCVCVLCIYLVLQMIAVPSESCVISSCH